MNNIRKHAYKTALQYSLAAIMLFQSSASFATPDVFVQGEGGGNVKFRGVGGPIRLAAVGGSLPGRQDWWHNDRWRLDQDWRFRLAYWWTRDDNANRQIWDVSAVPTLRLSRSRASEFTPFAEFGIGLHAISHTRIDERRLGTAAQFGEHLGVGISLGERQQYALVARIEHVSNARVKIPNDGVTFTGLELRCELR